MSFESSEKFNKTSEKKKEDGSPGNTEELKNYLDEKGISHNLGTEEERLERFAKGIDWRLSGVNQLTEMLNDLGSAILDVDSAYKEMGETIKEQADDFGKHFFEQARFSVGVERLRYVQGLKRLRGIIGENEYQKVLKNLLTNEETIEELARKGKEEISALEKYSKKKKSFWSKLR